MNAPPTYRVALLATDGARVEFEASPTQSLVKAAARAGYRLTTGCMQGRCAICRAQLVSGTVQPLRRPSPYAVEQNGLVRLCSVTATSDVEVAPLSGWQVVATG